MTRLRQRGFVYVREAIRDADGSNILLDISKVAYNRHLLDLSERYRQDAVPEPAVNIYVYCKEQQNSVNVLALKSKQIKLILTTEKLLTNTKMLNVTNDVAARVYANIKKIKSIQSRTRLLRLIHGDVYCGSRLKKFNMTDNDRCHRCFDEETINHLLLDCPYT